MIRNIVKKRTVEKSAGEFRFRGVDNTRIEALSDGVFAIAIALLIISASMPKTFDELLLFIDDILPFGICMTLLMVIWYQHYIFFIRYGFKDASIVSLNTLLLFLVLFYVYPLKFLFTLLVDLWSGLFWNNQELLKHLFTEVININQAPNLMTIYGFGAMSIFLTLAGMYFIAYKRRLQLELTAVEIFDTKTSLMTNLLMSSVPILSIIISLLPISSRAAFSFSGLVYLIYPLIMIPFGIKSGKRRVRLLSNS